MRYALHSAVKFYIKMKYKKSKYNILLRDEENNLVIGNTLTGAVQKYAVKIADQITECLKREKFDDSDALCRILAEDGILVDESFEEDQIAEFQFNKLVYGEQALDLIVVPTDACNMRCVYCYEPHIEHYMDEEKVSAFIKFLKKRMRTASSLHISWFGGEPLLCHEIIYQIMEQAQQFGKLYKIPVSANATTNGVLLTPEVFDHLYECGVRSYQITIDGFREKHNQSRPLAIGGDSFSIIESNLKYIMQSDRKVVVHIRYNVTADNINDSYRFIDYLKETYFHDKRFFMHLYNVRDWGGDSVHNLSLTSYASLGKLVKYALSKGVNPIGPPFIAYENLHCELATLNSFYINWDLGIHKCYSTVYNSDCSIGQIGSINSSGVATIDQKKLALWSVPPHREGKCMNCPFYAACMSFSCPYEYKIHKNKDCRDFQSFMTYKIQTVGQITKAKSF